MKDEGWSMKILTIAVKDEGWTMKILIIARRMKNGRIGWKDKAPFVCSERSTAKGSAD